MSKYRAHLGLVVQHCNIEKNAGFYKGKSNINNIKLNKTQVKQNDLTKTRHTTDTLVLLFAGMNEE